MVPKVHDQVGSGAGEAKPTGSPCRVAFMPQCWLYIGLHRTDAVSCALQCY